jgi:hypothetical protein
MSFLFKFVHNLYKPQQPATDEYNCPICLEVFSDRRTEICENGHRIHRECAMQMHFHMKSQCPLCRSMMVCSSCGSKMRNMRCNCSGMPDQPGHGWTMVKYQICLLIAIVLIPHKDTTSISLVCMVNFCAMTRRIMAKQPKRVPGVSVKKQPRPRSAFLIMSEIGEEVIMVLPISFSIVLVYSWCLGQH